MHLLYYYCRHKQLDYLEKLHPGNGPFFVQGPKRVTGGYAIAAVLDMAHDLEPTVLDAHPKMKGFYEAMMALPEFQSVRSKLHPYFSRA
jgi:hypothetical protein